MPRSKTNSRAGQTIEAMVDPKFKQRFAYFASQNGISQQELASQCLRIGMDYKTYNYRELMIHDNSPLMNKVNQIAEQVEQLGALQHRQDQVLDELIQLIVGSSSPRPTDIGGDGHQ